MDKDVPVIAAITEGLFELMQGAKDGDTCWVPESSLTLDTTYGQMYGRDAYYNRYWCPASPTATERHTIELVMHPTFQNGKGALLQTKAGPVRIHHLEQSVSYLAAEYPLPRGVYPVFPTYELTQKEQDVLTLGRERLQALLVTRMNALRELHRNTIVRNWMDGWNWHIILSDENPYALLNDMLEAVVNRETHAEYTSWCAPTT